MYPQSLISFKYYSLHTFLAIILVYIVLLPSETHAGVTSARLQCQYSFSDTTNLIQDPSCTLQSIANSVLSLPLIPASPPLSPGALSPAPTGSSPWSHTPGWVYNPIFSCCSFSQSTPPDSGNDTSAGSTSPTLITTVDLSASSELIDEGQQQLELSISYYTGDGPATPQGGSSSNTFQVIVRFLDVNGAYIILGNTGEATELNPGEAESLLYYSFDAITMEPVRIPVGARGAVLQILVPASQTSFCFDYFAMRLLQGSFHPKTESLVQKILIGLGALVLLNAAVIPIILFYGLPGWLWKSAPVNFFQKNPVVDHFVPVALFISTCQWIYNILLQYLGGSSTKINIIHSPYSLWLIPLVLIGTFFASAFAHWALFLCYNQAMQIHRQSHITKARRWRAPLLGLWASLCLLIARAGVVFLAIIQGGFWSVPIGIMLAVPETIAMISVMFFFIKIMWKSSKNDSKPSSRRGISNKGIGGIPTVTINSNKSGADLSRSSSIAPLWESNSPTTFSDEIADDLINLSSFHHRAYVKSLLTPEHDLRDAAGSMYGRSTVGSDKSAPYIKSSGKSNGDNKSRYADSTLNTTTSMSNSSATAYSRNSTEYGFNMSKDPRKYPPLSPSAIYERGRGQFPFEQPKIQQQQYSGAGRKSSAPSEKSTSAPYSRSGQGRSLMYSIPTKSREGLNAHKLTWNSATTSYTATSAAQPMTGIAPTPSAWEYIVYPKRHIWPTIVGAYLLIVRLPLRILVAVTTTLVLCYDVLLSIGAAETVLAVPVSCLLGGMSYPGASQFDNTMNVARAMHTVNLVLLVVLLPAVVLITGLHQIRMIQKYNWCLRLLRIGNYGFVPGGREYKQHLKHPVRFIGYTVGFGVVGLCFTIFLLFTLCTIVAMLLVAATFRSSLFRSLGSRGLAAFGISCLLVLILWLVQMLVIRYRFRMPGSRFLLSPQKSAQASFHHWEFYWAFFNIVFGAFSFFKRIVLSVLSMGIYSTRIDLCIMGSRFRPWDGGYSAFVGLVLADHVLNNPVMLEFVQILRDLLMMRRHPHLAHYFLEARGRSSGEGNQDMSALSDREKRIMLMLSPQLNQQRNGAGAGGGRRHLNDIEEGQEARMDDLLMASGGYGGGVGGGGGAAIKGDAVVPEVSRIHHYFRSDQRVERHGPNQGPLGSSQPASSSSPHQAGYNKNNNRVSKIYTPLLTSEENKQVNLQDPRVDPDSAVSREQIHQRLSEAKLRSIRVRNRWFLYVTLARNPSIRSLRRTKAEDFLHPIAHGAEYTSSHLEEALADIQWDRED
ncbi:hypothetical protein BGZ76_000302 [Entomortierella beljakovae]|nr:hypothetical protein BGZ76_000302 [Entomortierella beljakovae]